MVVKSKKRKKIYSYTVRMDGEMEEPIKFIANQERRSVNDEIAVAVEEHIKKYFPDYGIVGDQKNKKDGGE